MQLLSFTFALSTNYSATWKAQEKKKSRDTNVQVPVSVNIIHWIVIVISKWLTASSLPASKVHQGYQQG